MLAGGPVFFGLRGGVAELGRGGGLNMSFFSYVTPATYAVSVVLWVFVAVFYFRRRRGAKADGRFLLDILLSVLLIDAGRTIFESLFFGAWYSARVGLLPSEVYDFLVQPHIVFVPKLVNVVVAMAVITIILRRWLPQEDEESRTQRSRAAQLEATVQDRTQQLVEANTALREDVARRERVEQELRASESRFRDVAETSPSWIWETDAEGVYTFASDRVASVLGYTPQEVVGRAAQEFAAAGADTEAVLWTPPEELEERSVFEQEVWAQSKQGERICLLRCCIPRRDESGALVGFRGVDHNITPRKLAEARVRRQKVTFESLFDAMPDAILLTDKERRITAVNRGFTNTFGYELSEVAGESTSIIYESDEEFLRQGRERYNLTVAQRSSPYVVTYRRKDGQLLPGETIGTKVITTDGEVLGFFGLVRDISERQSQEHSIRQMQKMEAIGTLSGGIAHDFNNILASIVGYADLLKMEATEGSDNADYSGEILTAARRATDLVSQILTFARKRDEVMTPIALHTVVEEAMRLLRPTIPTTINIALELAADDDTVLGDATQMHQVVMNLGTNAFHAMRDSGGTLTASVTSMPLTSAQLATLAGVDATAIAGPYVRLTLADTGPGMSAETVAQVFEPFFTTKPVGEGTGIGMAVVHGIVRNHQGAISIDSVLGEGTAVHVYFPQSKSLPPQILPAESSPSQGQGRIMVVDDEPAIAKVVARLLVRAGYEAAAFTSSPAALAHFKEDPDRYDMVVTDQTMPDLTGDQFAQALLSVRPGLPVIICTGYSQVITPQRAEEIGVSGLLMKPVPSATLTRVVRETLAARDQ